LYKIEDLINLLNVPNIGPNRLRKLISVFETTENVFNASVKQLKQIPGINENIAQEIKKNRDSDFGQNQIRMMEKHNVRVVTFWDKEFPRNLKMIHDPPVLLFVRGNLLYKDKYSLAVVGTRRPTESGRIIAEKFAEKLSSMGITIVSGLARGIDSAAHKGAVNGGGRTIAVLGSGLDRIYPSENARLAQKIANSGALVSEFTMGTGPDRENFPRRNRIISGISLGTLVVEAGKTSGSFITAEFAVEQNREVFAIPGAIQDKKSIGTNKLIMKGEAKLVQNIDDILVEIEPQLKGLQAKLEVEEPRVDLKGDEKKLFNLLSREPVHIDTICKKGNMDSPNALSLLLSLELKGLIKQLPGMMFVKY